MYNHFYKTAAAKRNKRTNNKERSVSKKSQRVRYEFGVRPARAREVKGEMDHHGRNYTGWGRGVQVCEVKL